jgi:hypothetical protein
MSFDLKKYLANNPLLEDAGFEKNQWIILLKMSKRRIC